MLKTDEWVNSNKIKKLVFQVSKIKFKMSRVLQQLYQNDVGEWEDRRRRLILIYDL